VAREKKNHPSKVAKWQLAVGDRSFDRQKGGEKRSNMGQKGSGTWLDGKERVQHYRTGGTWEHGDALGRGQFWGWEKRVQA